MQPKVQFTPSAAALLQRVLADHRELVLLIDDTSCCSNSSIMLREKMPAWPVSLLAEQDSLKVCVNPVFERSLKASKMLIDALEFSDDSLSLETNYGRRLIVSIEPGP